MKVVSDCIPFIDEKLNGDTEKTVAIENKMSLKAKINAKILEFYNRRDNL